jgi:PEP phosphonomutase and related enzymes
MKRLFLNTKAPSRIVGAYDAVTARLIERADFDGIWASGLCISAAFGLPDANIMSFDSFLEVLRTLVRATSIPIIADCDTGYGDFHNVIHVVKELCRSGVAGFCIEDKVFPKINSFSLAHAQDLETAETFAAKIHAAAEQKIDPNFLVIARVEALIAGAGMEEALRRGELYRQAGADALVIHSKKSEPDEILEFARRWQNRLPLVIIPTTYPTLSMEQITRSQIAGVIFANQLLRASMHTQREYLAQLARAASLSKCTVLLDPVKDIFDIQGMPRYETDEQIYRQYEAALCAPKPG